MTMTLGYAPSQLFIDNVNNDLFWQTIRFVSAHILEFFVISRCIKTDVFSTQTISQFTQVPGITSKKEIYCGNFHTKINSEMEFKVRKESQTMMEKVFNTYERRGSVRSYQLGSMLKAMRPDIEIEQTDLDSIVSQVDADGQGKFDLDSFNRIAVHFLMKAARRDSDSFIHLKQVYLANFD